MVAVDVSNKDVSTPEDGNNEGEETDQMSQDQNQVIVNLLIFFKSDEIYFRLRFCSEVLIVCVRLLIFKAF